MCGLFLIFGGTGYTEWKRDPYRNRPRETYETPLLPGDYGYKSGESLFSGVISDMWVWFRDVCPANCSYHGKCFYGTCLCDEGYYGIDCSNISCPGDFCYYDDQTMEQICVHCCSNNYVHTDTDVYIPDTRKVACDHDQQYHECMMYPLYGGVSRRRCWRHGLSSYACSLFGRC